MHKSWVCFSIPFSSCILATQLLPVLPVCKPKLCRIWSPVPKNIGLCCCHAHLLLLQREGLGNELLIQLGLATVPLWLPGA